MKIIIPEFKTLDEKFGYLRQHKDTMKVMKKADKKLCAMDGAYFLTDETENKQVSKSLTIKEDLKTATSIRILPAINTTKYMDSHDDMHVDGIWNRSLNNKERIRLLLESHKNDFDYVISDNVKAYAKTLPWSAFGKSYAGTTEALVYETIAERERNEKMFNHYVKGWVLNHSVGMWYKDLRFAMKSDNRADIKERDIWEQYYPMMANKERADEMQYFWAVLEAVEIEGSAVPMGSNPITSTISVEAVGSEKSTLQTGSEKSTQSQPRSIFDY